MATTQMPIKGVFDVSSGKLTGIVSPTAPEITLVGVPPTLKAAIPGREPSTQFLDVSGNAANLVPDSGNDVAFATADYFASKAGASGGLRVLGSKTLWTPSAQSILFAFVLKKAVPGASQNLMAWGGTTIAGNYGFYLSHRVTTGAIKIVPINNGALLNPQADSTLPFSDATPQDRHCMVAYDAPTGSWYIYRDGVLSNAFVNQMVGANAYTPGGQATLGIYWGSTAEANPASAVAAIGYGLQAYVIDGSLPANLGLLATKLAAAPRVPLAATDIQ